MDKWSIKDVQEHFGALGALKLAIFEEEQIDGKALLLLDEADLKELQIPLGIRRKHLEFVKSQSRKTAPIPPPRRHPAIVYSDGSVYSGGLKNDKRSGFGRLKHP
jgi:hypothetical protein